MFSWTAYVARRFYSTLSLVFERGPPSVGDVMIGFDCIRRRAIPTSRTRSVVPTPLAALAAVLAWARISQATSALDAVRACLALARPSLFPWMTT